VAAKVTAPPLEPGSVSETNGFAQRFATLRAERGPFCLGLDPTRELLQAWGLQDTAAGLRSFCDRVMEAAGVRLCVIKPQSAYFERFGPAGLEVMSGVIDAAHAAGSLVLLDVKRGDIGATNEAYADAFLGVYSAFRADAITLHPYLGFGALQPFADRALRAGGGLFVVVLSSNPEGQIIQHAQVAPGLSVADHLCDEITRCNLATVEGSAAVGPIGAVLGLTAAGAPAVLARLPRSLLLVPGLGAQGGTFEQLAERFAPARSRVLPSSSRAVLAAGPDSRALEQAIEEHCQRAAEALA
jgi:orotidine-5'-phosphate decarboxylase